MKFLAGLVLLVGLFACSNTVNKSGGNVDFDNARDSSGNSLKPQKALGFRIDAIDKGSLLTLLDPWNQNNVFGQYIIIPAGRELPPEEGPENYIPLPLDKWAVSSTTHIGFMAALGESARITGCTSPDRIYDEELISKYRRGEIVRIGNDMDFNLESVLGSGPDIILQTAFEGQRNKDRQLASTGVDILYILEWMEPHPLGRAEWIKVFGLLLNKSALADSIYNQVSEHYSDLKVMAAAGGDGPVVMLGNNFKGTWYMPGGQNYMSRFLEDAGFQYPLQATDTRGSLALNFENVLDRFLDAEIWLGVSSQNLDDLLAGDPLYARFKPFKSGKIYSIYGRTNSSNANDFWESGVVYPDLVLEDLISIAHPDLLPGHSLFYYKKIKTANDQ